ncbi:hypothetical protein Shyhy01_20080 [Streptomyces hygroscopicus subsp. hygroscopicus]|nr:hypothetical protein Shyhy01_20080 [Streptomyces hygroscopicus subsp. hygroscopicus]
MAAHQPLGGPIVLIRDNLDVHKADDLREFAATRDWLTSYHLPPRASSSQRNRPQRTPFTFLKRDRRVPTENALYRGGSAHPATVVRRQRTTRPRTTGAPCPGPPHPSGSPMPCAPSAVPCPGAR